MSIAPETDKSEQDGQRLLIPNLDLYHTRAVGHPTTPDLWCPKCGNDDVAMDYQRDGPCRYRHRYPCEFTGQGEHFHRYCRRCSFEWSTDDVLGGGS